MEESGVKHVIPIRSFGIYDTPLNSFLVPYRKAASVFEGSNLDSTITEEKAHSE